MFAITAAFLLSAIPVAAQDTATTEEQKDLDGINLQLFRPSIFGGNFVAIEDAHTLTRWSPGLAVLGDYANSVWSKYEDQTDIEVDFISEMSTAHLMAAFGTFSWLSLGVDVPLHYTLKRTFADIETGEGISENLENWREVGDIRAEAKIGVLREDKHWLGLALAPYVIFPTEVEEHLLGENRLTGGGTMAIEHDFGPINIGLNGGYLVRDRNKLYGTEIGDAVRYGAGLSNKYDSGFFWSLEGWGSVFDIEDTDLIRNYPVEVTFVMGWQFGERGPRLFAGGGPGVTDGIGAPSYRVLGGLSYYYVREDLGRLEVRVVGPNNEPLDATIAVQGPKGAFDAATQNGDYATDAKKGTYGVNAAAEGYLPGSGTAEVMPGKTGLVMIKLAAIEKPKTTLSFKVADKCDGKTVPAKVAVSPGGAMIDASGTKQIFQPGQYTAEVSYGEYQTVTVSFTVAAETDNAVEVSLIQAIKPMDAVYFAVNRDVILPQSFPVLDDVAKQIKSLCQLEKVTIEGHTDSDGSDMANQNLSERRAASVRKYLMEQGIDPAKLESVGYGESKPVADNTTKDGKAANRRVEFIAK